MLQLLNNYPLKNLTTLQIGGPAKKFVIVKTEAALIEALQYADLNDLNHLIIGWGSNLLVSDEKINYLIIKNEISGIKQKGQNLKVKSGTKLQDLVNYSIEHGLSGLEKLAGIPGTVGGAVFGNAGAYGQTISDHIITVKTMDSTVIADNALSSKKEVPPIPMHPDGSPCTEDIHLLKFPLTKKGCGFSYRDSTFKKQSHLIILEVSLQLQSGNPETLQQEADDILAKRKVKYPPGIKCPGSFFKNIVAATLPKEILDKIPPQKIVYGKLPAGVLLEQVGANGKSLDGIEISPVHANLFINKDGGTAQAFIKLARLYAKKVKEKFGITLESEVQFINLPPLT